VQDRFGDVTCSIKEEKKLSLLGRESLNHQLLKTSNQQTQDRFVETLRATKVERPENGRAEERG